MDRPGFPSEQAAANYLAGIIDGEGHVHDGRTAEGWPRRWIAICNTDRDIIDAVLDALLMLGVRARATSRVPRPPRKRFWEVKVARLADLRLIAAIVPIQAGSKRLALKRSLATARANRRPDRQTLERLYVFESRGCPEIGRQLGVADSTVRRWLLDEGIPLRPKTESTRLSWVERGERPSTDRC